MRTEILLVLSLVMAVGALLLHEDTLREIIANQKQQLALCHAPKLPAMSCQHYMDNIAADRSVTESCIRMTYRDLAVR